MTYWQEAEREQEEIATQKLREAWERGQRDALEFKKVFGDVPSLTWEEASVRFPFQGVLLTVTKVPDGNVGTQWYVRGFREVLVRGRTRANLYEACLKATALKDE